MYMISNLQKVSLNNIILPIVSMHTYDGQTLIPHKYPQIDGAFIECQTRMPYEVVLVIPCFNSLAKEFGNQFPNPYPDLLDELYRMKNSRTKQPFVHPVKGTFNVFIDSINDDMTAQHLDGVEIKVNLIETIDPDEQNLAQLQGSDEYITQASYFQNQLVAESKLPERNKAKFKSDTSFMYDFYKTMNNIQNNVNKASLAQKRVVAQYNKFVGCFQRSYATIQSLKSDLSFYTSDTINQYNKIKQIVDGKCQAPITPQLKSYYIPKRMAIPEVLRRLKITFDTYQKYNPNLQGKIILEPTTKVIYE